MTAATVDSAREALDALADVFEYPGADYPVRVAAAAAAAAAVVPAAADSLAALLERTRSGGRAEWEELHVRTFDLSPLCTPEIGWQLYGEQYARGTFLASMRAHLRDVGVDEGSELPDHVTLVLRGLARAEGERAQTLARRFVLPAVEKMRGQFGDAAHPYRGALDAVAAVVAACHAAAEEVPGE